MDGVVEAASILYWASLLSTTAGIVSAIAGSRRCSRIFYALGSLLAVSSGIIVLVSPLATGKPAFYSTRLPGVPLWPRYWWSPLIGMGGLGASFLIAIGLAGLVASTYSGYYWRLTGVEAPRAYMVFMGVSLLSMYLLVACFDLILLLVCWEAMTASLALMVSYGHDARGAAMLYIVLLHVVSIPMFACIAWLLAMGVHTYTGLAMVFRLLGPFERLTILSCFLVAFMAKSGLAPFYFWLPPAHSRAPTDSSIILSGASVKPSLLQALLIMFIALRVSRINPLVFSITTALSAISLVLGVLGALWCREAKRILAYSTVAWMGLLWLVATLYLVLMIPQLAFAVMGLAIAHAAYKSLSFAATGVAREVWGTDSLAVMGGCCGVGSRSCLLAFTAVASMLPIPPLPAFAGELLVLYVLASNAPVSLVVVGALILVATCIPVLVLAYARLASGLLSTVTPSVEYPDAPRGFTSTALGVALASPLIVAVTAYYAGLSAYWLLLYIILLVALIASPRMRLARPWVSGELVEAVAGLMPFSVKPPTPRSIEAMFSWRYPRPPEARYDSAYYAVARLLSRAGRRVLRMHSGRLIDYLACMLIFFVSLIILVLILVVYRAGPWW